MANSASQLVLDTADGERFIVSGTDMVLAGAARASETSLLGDTVEPLSFGTGGRTLVSFATLQTTGVLLWRAVAAERAGGH